MIMRCLPNPVLKGDSVIGHWWQEIEKTPPEWNIKFRGKVVGKNKTGSLFLFCEKAITIIANTPFYVPKRVLCSDLNVSLDSELASSRRKTSTLTSKTLAVNNRALLKHRRTDKFLRGSVMVTSFFVRISIFGEFLWGNHTYIAHTFFH